MRHPRLVSSLRTATAVFAVLVLLAAGCNLLGSSSDDAGRWTVERGAIVFFQDTTTITLSAATVRVGETLRVGATSFGGGCTEPAGTRTDVDGLRATVVVLDSLYITAPDEGCTDELRVHPHEAGVVFERAGDAVVVIEGALHDASGRGGIVRFERSVTVVE